LVWGARTLDGNSNEWRYISVRRFFNMVEESVKKATERFVFEPNTANTWIRVQTMIENFLNQQWQDGALAGSKPEEAYYVSVGLKQNNVCTGYSRRQNEYRDRYGSSTSGRIYCVTFFTQTAGSIK
jgi:phage tail sheath protein FI